MDIGGALLGGLGVEALAGAMRIAHSRSTWGRSKDELADLRRKFQPTADQLATTLVTQLEKKGISTTQQARIADLLREQEAQTDNVPTSLHREAREFGRVIRRLIDDELLPIFPAVSADNPRTGVVHRGWMRLPTDHDEAFAHFVILAVACEQNSEDITQLIRFGVLPTSLMRIAEARASGVQTRASALVVASGSPSGVDQAACGMVDAAVCCWCWSILVSRSSRSAGVNFHWKGRAVAL